MLKNSGDELPSRTGEGNLIVGVVEGVGIAFKQAEVGVHSRSRAVFERLGHECGMHALLGSHLLDEVAERHDVVCHGQHIGMAQVDLLLPG